MFAVEQSIVSLALIGITVLMFINVVARRIEAPDSKVGALLAKLGGVDDPETLAWLGASVAPWVTLLGAFALIVFGHYTWKRFLRQREGLGPPPLARTLPVGALTALALIALGWAFAFTFERLESRVVFAGLFGGSTLAFAGWMVKARPDGFVIKALIALVGGAAVSWFCMRWFPIGYTWTNKISLMLLLWVGMLGASICVHEGKHIRMEALGRLAPAKAQRYLVALGFLVAAAFAALMSWLGVLYTFDLMASDDPELPALFTLFGERVVVGTTGAYALGGRIEGTEIPDWVGTLSVIVGFGLATLRFLGAAVSSLLGGEYGAPAPDEGMEEARAAATGDASEASS